MVDRVSKESHLLYIVNPPSFKRFDTERNIYTNDGVIAFLHNFNTYYYVLNYHDYSFYGETIVDLFKDISELKPEVVYLNLNDYDNGYDFNLAIGIKKHSPNSKIIVGPNIPKEVIDSLSSDILKCISEWFDYDEKDLFEFREDDKSRVIFDTPLDYNFCNSKHFFSPIFYTSSGFITNGPNLLESNNGTHFFAFRMVKKCPFNDLIEYVKELNSYHNPKFILDDMGYTKEELLILKKYGLIGIVSTIKDLDDLKEKINKYQKLRLKVLFRIPFIDISKESHILDTYNMYFELMWSKDIFLKKFFVSRQLKMLDFLYNKLYTKYNLKYGLLDKYLPNKRHFLKKYLKYLYKETKYTKEIILGESS